MRWLAVLLLLAPSVAYAQSSFAELSVESAVGRVLGATRRSVARRAEVLAECGLGRSLEGTGRAGAVRLTVDARGRVTRVDLGGDDDDPTAWRACVRRALGRIVLVAASGETSVVGHLVARRVDSETVERMLDGQTVDPGHGSGAVEPPMPATPLSGEHADPPPPTVPGTLEIEGFPGEAVPDRSVLTRAMRAAQTRLLRCYERALARTPSLAGRVAFHVEVSAQGRLRARRVGDAFDADTELCLVRTFAGIQIAVTDAPEDDTFEPILVFAPAAP